ncbi:VTC domain-containing protein [Lachnotalea glycerini]|uniref:VTC domain-containing protein n=1 Tax=Lachnotalea glycerini TaxID=1763509 RepID=A0A318EPH8_9FIRM|nr:polyphosphate polymerase domain-containing protein [Lachnotalea glycerini]PXV87292.1 VTC domain-containing protein [Lachnotalea glycerini]
MAVKYRHEFKYICNEMELAVIAGRLQRLMKPDKNAGEKGIYNIRSLYFEDYYNTCFQENEAGTDPREKFRIRIYNAATSRITLELKRKERGKTLKQSCPITIEQCQQLMKGTPFSANSQYPPILQKLNYLMQTRRMKPIIIVDYDRTPYVCQDGNVRVTMDRNISSSPYVMDFLNPSIRKRPIMPAGQHILEVKYDEFLPDYIIKNIEISTLRQTAFSKFYLCRIYK